MPREYEISWNANQRKRLNSAVRRYNNAIRRAVRKSPLAKDFLPQEVKYQDLKAQITTARALKNKVNSLLRITHPRALEFVRQDDGSLVTRYERREFSILRSVRERKKSMQAKVKGLEQPSGGIGTLEQASASRDTRPIGSFSAKSLRRFIETQERAMNASSWEKARRYMNNYRAALKTVFGGFPEYNSKIEEIEKKIKSMTRRRRYDDVMDAIDNAPSIDFIYDPLTREAKMEKIMEYWRLV